MSRSFHYKGTRARLLIRVGPPVRLLCDNPLHITTNVAYCSKRARGTPGQPALYNRDMQYHCEFSMHI